MIPENEDKIRLAWKNNKIKGLESAYLSASDKVLRLGVQNERLQANNKALLEACREARKYLLEEDASELVFEDVINLLDQAINATQR